MENRIKLNEIEHESESFNSVPPLSVGISKERFPWNKLCVQLANSSSVALRRVLLDGKIRTDKNLGLFVNISCYCLLRAMRGDFRAISCDYAWTPYKLQIT